MKHLLLVVILCAPGCAPDHLGVLYLGIDLTGSHDVELPAELGAVSTAAMDEATGRVDAFPAEGHMTVDVVGLPALPVDFAYVPVFAFAEHERSALGPHGAAGHSHAGLAWDLEGPALAEDDDGGMAAMLMLGEDAEPGLGALRNAGVKIVGSPELEPPVQEVLVLEGELVLDDEPGDAEGGGAEPAGHNHGP